MADFVREMPVSVLELSNRSYNVLMRNGIDTVGKLFALSEDELRKFRNLGEKSTSEILAARLKIAGTDFADEFDASIDLVRSYELPDCGSCDSNGKKNERCFMGGDGFARVDLLIEQTSLSVRAKNCLAKSGYAYISELVGIKYEDVIHIKNMGKKTAEEIVLFASSIELCAPMATQVEQLDERKKDFVYSLEKNLGLVRGSIMRDVYKMFADGNNLDGESLCHRMYSLDYIREALKRRILSLLEDVEEMAEDTLAQKLPQHLLNTTILQDVLIELECTGTITYENGVAARKYITCREFAENLKDERKRTGLLMRLDGCTLEEIGNKFGITRERIRQLVANALKNRPRFYEDKYKYIFENYEFSKEDFFLAFDEPAEVYYCLDTITNRGKTSILKVLFDENVSVKMKRRAEKAIYKSYLTIDGVRVLKQRRDLVRFAVKKFANDKISYDDFEKKYGEFLDELGLAEDESFFLNGRTYETHLASCDYVLWNQWRSFRYYNINDRDYADLHTAIHLEQYEDVELSALKFFNDFPDLMFEYDIRDEYELHNLLKKTYKDIEGVDFKRMPTIVIGNADPEMQLLDLLVEHSPIDGVELCKKYEETYGGRASSVAANILSNLWEYCDNGIYSMDADGLAPEEFERMKEVLAEDFYTVKDLARIYQREFPNSSIKQMNPYMIKSLGFRLYSGYAVSANYPNAAEYFRRLLLAGDVVDGREFPNVLGNIGTYTAELAELKVQRVIFEYLPKQYINISRLESIGVGIADIEDYCKCVCDCVDYGEYFTVKSLNQKGFGHKLYDLGFDDWFYASLITEDREDFSYVRMGGAKLFYRGKKAVLFENFLQYLLRKYRRIELYDLLDMLQDEYGLKQTKEDVIYTVRGSDMYYDAIMETVYIDYDTYYEEI